MDGRYFSHFFRRSASALRQIIPALLVLWLCALGRPAGAQTTGTAPDLVAENLSFTPSAVTLGTIVKYPKRPPYNVATTFTQDRVTVQVTIRNKGTRASIPMIARVWASPDAAIDGTGNDILLASFPVPGLAPGATDDHTGKNTAIKIDPNFVGFYQNLFLAPGDYHLGVQVDSFDENPGELDEHNFFAAAGTVNVSAKKPRQPFTPFLISTNPTTTSAPYSSEFVPGNGTDIASVSRDVEWTSAPYANRYNLYFGRIKDLEQRFLPAYLTDSQPDMQKIYVSDFGGPIEASTIGGGLTWGNSNGGGNNLYDPAYLDPSPDLLITQDTKLQLYLNKNYTLPYHPQFYPPMTVFQSTTYTMLNRAARRVAGRQYSVGSISCALPVNVNFYWTDAPHNGRYTTGDDYMDIAFAEYMDPNTWDPRINYSNGLYNGSAHLLVNASSFMLGAYGGYYYNPPRPELTTFTLVDLPNHNPNTNADYHPYGIKCLAGADFDNDTDIDFIVGADRYFPGDQDRVVIYQSSYRQVPQGDTLNVPPGSKTPGPLPPFLPQFEPTFHDGTINNRVEDVNDMAVGDLDGDGRMDIAMVSFYGNCCWIMHNKTDVGGDVRSTRTLSFDLIGPLQRFDNNGTTVPLVGASTVCTSELYYRGGNHKPDIIAGGYIDGKAIVYENRSTYSGDTMNDLFIPHTLNNFITPDILAQIGVSTVDDLQNLEKVTVADMNGDGAPDIIVSWATNDTVIWFENQMKDNFGQYVFKAHLATAKANRVSWFTVADMNNDLLPDIITVSEYADTPCQWYLNNPAFTSKNRVASKLLQPKWQPPQMDFNTMYAWQLESWTGDIYSTTSQVQTFRTQPTRALLYPTLGAYNQIEPGAGFSLSVNYVMDGPQQINGPSVQNYADPILTRGFQLANAGDYYGNSYYWTNVLYDGNPVKAYFMRFVGAYPLNMGFTPGTRGQFSVNFLTTNLPEGLYNFYSVLYGGDTPTYVDGVRNGLLDGVGDGFDGVTPWTIRQLYTNDTWGDDCYLAREKLAVAYKPGLPQIPKPLDGSTNIPTSTKLGWSTTNYTTGYDVYLAKSSLAAPTYTSTTISLAVPATTSIATGDIDGDGQIDLATSYYNGGAGHIAWLKNQSVGRTFHTYDIPCDLNGPADISIANLDADTRPDVLAASPYDSEIVWYRNLGGSGVPAFSAANFISAQAGGVNTARPVDLNNDGKIDVLAAMTGPKRLCWYENTGIASSWTEHAIDPPSGQQPVNGTPMFAIPGDVNGDGLQDLIVASWAPNSIAWYENRGGANPAFVRHVIDTSINSSKWLAVGDINSDGGLDIVSVSSKDGSIVWFENDRSFPPNFIPHVIASGISGLHNLVVADYNHDAKPDIITAIDNGNRVLFYANNGDSPLTFTQYTINSQASQVCALAAADLDSDTFKEVINTNTGGAMYWYDYVTNFQYGNLMTKSNNLILTSSLVAPLSSQISLSGASLTWSSLPTTLAPSEGYKWQVAAKRQVPIYGGTYERVTSSTVWSFQTSQCDLAALKLDLSTRSVPQGKHVMVTVTEDNIGLSDAAPHVTEVWASPDPNFTRGTSDVYLGAINMPAIAAGGRAIGTLDVNTARVGVQGNLTMAMGYYYIGCFVNTTNAENSESRKDNNFTYNSGRLQILHGNAAQSWSGYK